MLEGGLLRLIICHPVTLPLWIALVSFPGLRILWGMLIFAFQLGTRGLLNLLKLKWLFDGLVERASRKGLSLFIVHMVWYEHSLTGEIYLFYSVIFCWCFYLGLGATHIQLELLVKNHINLQYYLYRGKSRWWWWGSLVLSLNKIVYFVIFLEIIFIWVVLLDAFSLEIEMW